MEGLSENAWVSRNSHVLEMVIPKLPFPVALHLHYRLACLHLPKGSKGRRLIPDFHAQ